ncbi:DUF4422 domain-containing protein [Adlercreutzia sp. ZJ242]|uniref:DUF4422 domain-containing protein n=1 Tax=Adlercreutzia sp. ZJ242 TaxID=2709409 RepID=UPI0019804983|nr:DUF4422 domain-containing protein [Adlercreutzia sp. ZJ242]
MAELRIAVASHKPYWMPPDPAYLPVQVGAAGRDPIPGFARDDEGDGISEKNSNYCELTALYWAWKNIDADHLGLVHYRRHFAGSGERGVMTGAEALADLGRAPVLLPRERRYYVETIESHYGHTFDPAHIDVLRQVLSETSPERLLAFERRMRMTHAHMLNMAVMRADVLGAYCGWLFDVLARAEEMIDFEGMTPFEARCMGRLSELLLDVWLDSEGVPCVERPVVSMESVSWVRKGTAFLAAKFLGRKYEESF